MKALKYILISFGILILLFVGFGYLQDREVSVSRSIVIHAPVGMVFEQFNDLEKRIVWSPWEKLDSTMVTSLGKTTKGVGASYTWTSQGSESGKLVYKEVVPNQLIESQLYFGNPDDEPSQELMIFEEVEDGTKVTWEVHMDMGNNPFMRLMGRYMDDIVGVTFEMGLNSVKEICEAEAEKLPQIEVVQMEVESKPCIGLLDSCTLDQLEKRLGTDNGMIFTELATNNLQMSGYPRVVYHVWEPPTKVVFEVQLVLLEPTDLKTNRVIAGNTYGGKVLKATHIGPYEDSEATWKALDAYVNENGFEVNGSPWEEYENNPQLVNSPKELITHIYFPVK